MQSTYHYVLNGTGWKLALKQTYDPLNYNPALRPLAIIPGYGMNAYILGYHPRDVSMEEYLAEQGFEVWSLNLRNQSPSCSVGGGIEYTIQEIVREDLATAVDCILEKTRSQCQKVDLIGCSLGGTYAYLYPIMVDPDKAGSLVGIGSPFRMQNIHPAFALITRSPRLLGMIKFSHTRILARYALPLVIKVPKLICIYLHPEIVDTRRPDLLCLAVEDPNRRLNTQLAHWIKQKDLIIDGENMTEAAAKIINPVLCVMSNADGIVNEETALCILDAVSSEVKDTFTAGNDSIKMAHADLFISNYARSMVFEPLAEWLLKQN